MVKLRTEEDTTETDCKLRFLRTEADYQIEIWVNGKLVLDHGRRWLQFQVNLDELELAFNVRDEWLKKYKTEWLTLHFHEHNVKEFLLICWHLSLDASV